METGTREKAQHLRTPVALSKGYSSSPNNHLKQQSKKPKQKEARVTRSSGSQAGSVISSAF